MSLGTKHWTPPSDLTQLFQSSTINLDVSICYPNPGSPVHRHSWRSCTGREYCSIKGEICNRSGCAGLSDAKAGRKPWDQAKEMMILNEVWKEHEEVEERDHQLTKNVALHVEESDGVKGSGP